MIFASLFCAGKSAPSKIPPQWSCAWFWCSQIDRVDRAFLFLVFVLTRLSCPFSFIPPRPRLLFPLSFFFFSSFPHSFSLFLLPFSLHILALYQNPRPHFASCRIASSPLRRRHFCVLCFRALSPRFLQQSPHQTCLQHNSFQISRAHIQKHTGPPPYAHAARLQLNWTDLTTITTLLLLHMQPLLQSSS